MVAEFAGISVNRDVRDLGAYPKVRAAFRVSIGTPATPRRSDYNQRGDFHVRASSFRKSSYDARCSG
jgi:hypothetical protein